MQVDIDSLIRDLRDPSRVGEETQHALIKAGPGVVQPLVQALGDLDAFGKLMAIDVFDALDDQAAAPALVDLLADEDSTVRQWAARLLGRWRFQPAVPALRSLHAWLLATHIPPDWIEPLAVRSALASVGARSVVTPPLTASLEVVIAGTHGWRPGDLPRVIADLADNDQFVVHLLAWHLGRGDAVYRDGQLYWVGHPSPVEWRYSPLRTWAENVSAARDAALAEAMGLPQHVDLVVVDWMSETDMSPDAW